MPTVYRYENEYGEGPYMAKQFPKMETTHSGNMTRWPTWSFDGLEYPASTFGEKWLWRSGFDSEAKAHQWFNGFETDLRKQGFKLKSFEAEEIHLGDSGKQLIFRTDEEISPLAARLSILEDILNRRHFEDDDDSPF